MFRSRNKLRLPPFDARTPSVRRPRSRRLSIEAMESRLLLSGNQASDGDLDYAIWNLDSIQNNYAIISQGDSLPAPSPSMESTADPAGTPIDVSWVAVPGMSLSASDALALSYNHFREAMSQGVLNSQQVSSLYLPLRDGFASDPYATVAPVYAIGVRNQIAAPVVGSEVYLLSGNSVFESDSTAYIAPWLLNSPGGSGPSPSLDLTIVPYDYTSRDATLILFDDDVRSSGDFDRDGTVTASDYMVWRDSVGSSDMLAYNNWKAHFGESIGDSIALTLLEENFAIGQGGVLDPQHTLSNDLNLGEGIFVHIGLPTEHVTVEPAWSLDYAGHGVTVAVADSAPLFGFEIFTFPSNIASFDSPPTPGGAIASMLEANPNLSFRDVQTILVQSSRGVFGVNQAIDLAGNWSQDSLATPELFFDPLANRGDFTSFFGELVEDASTPSQPVQLTEASVLGTAVVTIAPFESALDLATKSTAASVLPTVALNVADRPIAVVPVIQADVATTHAGQVVNSDSGAQLFDVSTAPISVDVSQTSPQQSQTDRDLAEAVDELLSEDTIIVYQSGATSSEGIADTGQVQDAGTVDVVAGDVATDSTVNQLAEGGMVAVEEIVGAVTSDSAGAAPSDTRIAAARESTDLVGELTRVAVMELIEGEAEPAAPHAADHVSLLAASDIATADQSATTSGEQQSIATRVAQVIAEQAGTAASMFAPVNPAYLATIANAAGQAFAAVIGAELNGSLSEATLESVAAADAARSEAFSQWGDDESVISQADADASDSWLSAAPLLVALACERTVAAKKKRQQRAAKDHPAQSG